MDFSKMSDTEKTKWVNGGKSKAGYGHTLTKEESEWKVKEWTSIKETPVIRQGVPVNYELDGKPKLFANITHINI